MIILSHIVESLERSVPVQDIVSIKNLYLRTHSDLEDTAQPNLVEEQPLITTKATKPLFNYLLFRIQIVTYNALSLTRNLI